VLGAHLRLKWPNDLVGSSGGKVAGLLAERTDDLVVIGMGVNLYWPDAPEGIGGLYEDDPGLEKGQTIAAAWAEDLLAELAAGPEGFLPSEYEQASTTIGSTVMWEGGGPARAVGIDTDGGLIVDDGAERRVLRSGQVRSVRPTTLTD
jgi:BirA family biotin operon repressor/biotin-[acetyl-CoA-carboxylase] ligase